MASAPNVFCLYGPPDESSCRAAVARTIHCLQREHALSIPEIAHAAGCTAQTIRNAYARETTLSLHSWSRLRFYFEEQSPQCFEAWDRLCRPEAAEATPESRIQRIERELTALKREVEERRGGEG